MHRSSFTIDSWSATRGISRAMYYKLRADGKAPKTHYVGNKPLISPDADDEWLRQREAESAQRETAGS
jgi:hypothetical protein